MSPTLSFNIKTCNHFLKSKCISELYWNFLKNINAQVLHFFFFFFFFLHSSSFFLLALWFEVKRYGQHKMTPSPLDSSWVCLMATCQRSRVGSARKGQYLCPVIATKHIASGWPCTTPFSSILHSGTLSNSGSPMFLLFLEQINHLSSYGTAFSLGLCPNI